MKKSGDSGSGPSPDLFPEYGMGLDCQGTELGRFETRV